MPRAKEERHHGYTVTLNYYTEEDVEEMIEFLNVKQPDYYIYGFEGTDEEDLHPHIHLYVHFGNARSLSMIKKQFTKQHHIEVVQDPAAMISYCKGYEKGLLKSLEENVYIENGIPIANGVCTGAQKVMLSIKEGKTYEQLQELYPSFMLFHGSKVKKWITETQPKAEHVRNLYIIPSHDKYDYASAFKTVHMTGEIETYDNEEALFITTYQTQFRVIDWVKGYPQKIKRGYEIVTINPKDVFIMYEHDDQKEYSHAMKLYGDYIN